MKKKVKKQSVPIKKSPPKENTTRQNPPVTKTGRYSFLILIILGLILYGNTFQHEFTVDDPWLISENQEVQKGLAAIPDLLSKTTFVVIDNIQLPTPYRP